METAYPEPTDFYRVQSACVFLLPSPEPAASVEAKDCSFNNCVGIEY